MGLPIKHDRRIELLTLKNQGWSFPQLARKFEVSETAVRKMYRRIQHLTIDDLEKMKLEENC